MIHQISNEKLIVQISDLGAEVQSVRGAEGIEYLWQDIVDKGLRLSAPILFPFVSWLYKSSFKSNGKIYQIPFLGFALTTVMQITEHSETVIEYEMKSTAETQKMYPFHFTFRVRYQLDGSTLRTTFYVYNDDEKTMHFSLGWHPTFQIPLEDGLTFNDYCYEFEEEAQPLRVMREENKYFGPHVPFPLEDGVRIRLDDEKLADEGLILLRDISKGVKLYSNKGRHGVSVKYPDMRFLVILHKREIPYITVEGWTSYMGRNNIVEDIASQPDLVPLAAGCEYRNEWEITFF